MYFSFTHGYRKITEGKPSKGTSVQSPSPKIASWPLASGIRGGLAGLAALAACVVLPILPTSSQAVRTIKIVVPVPPGGAGDILARQVAEQVGRAQGVGVVTENRPGAGTVIGTESVARAAPDGSTVLLNAPYMLIVPQLRKVNYDPLTSFEPVCYLVSSPGIIVVNSASPFRTLADLIEAARVKPGALTLASVGPGTAQHVGFEMLRRAAKVDLTYVPYPGGAPAINALLGQHVTAVFAEYAPLAGHLKAGTLRAIATSARSRIEPLPDLPTVAESGYRDYEVDLWWGVFAPAKTPNQTISQLAGWFTEALRAPEVQAKLTALGFSAVSLCGTDFAALLRKEFDRYGRVIREANIKAE
jgi:tripartite-type tricarboxylate transporter receptor subunit TctC